MEALKARSSELLLSIGDVADLTGVSRGLLRLWEREGLISPQRTSGGHRLYTAADVARLRQIAHLRRVEQLNAAAIRRELGKVEQPISPADAPHAETANPTTGIGAGASIGQRLRTLRIGQGLSLAEVAERAGLSTSFLSAVERGQSSISLGNLFKLADAYGTTVPGLNPDYQRDVRSVLHPSERPRFVASLGLVLIEDLISNPDALEAQRIEIQPGGGSEGLYSHPGEEFIYVLSGRLAFWIGEQEQYDLRAGDSLHFRSTQQHQWRNESDAPTTVLWINAPLVTTSLSDQRQ